MKLVISHGKTKRVIEGPFAVCISGRDLDSLIAQLLGARESARQEGGGFGYGWLHVRSDESEVLADTPPLGWDA